MPEPTLELLPQLIDYTRELSATQSLAVQALTDNAAAMQTIKDACIGCQKRCQDCANKQNKTLLRMIWALIIVIVIFAGIDVSKLAGLF